MHNEVVEADNDGVNDSLSIITLILGGGTLRGKMEAYKVRVKSVVKC